MPGLLSQLYEEREGCKNYNWYELSDDLNNFSFSSLGNEFSRMQRMFLIDFFSYSQFFTYTEKKYREGRRGKCPIQCEEEANERKKESEGKIFHE